MGDSEAASFRTRSTMLEGLELFRAVGAPRPFSSLILFLYACENEGLTFTELASLSGIHVATSSRLIKALAGSPCEPMRAAKAPLFAFET